MKVKTFIIYKITNTLNGKIYIGQYSNKKNKFNNYWGSGILIKKAILKYGKENFIKENIETCNSKKELNKKEQYWIKKLNAFKPFGYNIGTGGEGQDNFTYNPNKEEIRKKIGEKSKGRMAGEKSTFKRKSVIKKIKEYQKNNVIGKTFEERFGVEKAFKLKQLRKEINKNNKFGCKVFIAYSPCGIKHIVVDGIKKFCKEQGLKYETLRKKFVNNESRWQGWSIQRA